MYEQNPREMDDGSSEREVRVSEGSIFFYQILVVGLLCCVKILEH